MRNRRHTIRLDRASLTEDAIYRAHKYQSMKLVKLLDAGWQVNSVNSRGGTNVITVTSRSVTGESAIGCIYPNGLFMRPKKGERSIKWNWDYADGLVHATIPAHGVLD